MDDSIPSLTQALSVQFAGAKRIWIKDVYALDAALARIATQGLSHDVAHVKLDWWREELTRLQQGEPRHPRSQALHQHSPKDPLYLCWDDRLTAVEFELVGFEPSSVPELLTLIDRSHGALQRLLASSLGGADASTLSHVGLSLGRGLGLRDWLLKPTATDGLPQDTLLSLATSTLDDAVNALPKRAHAAQRHALVQAALAHAQLSALSHGRGHLTPTALSHWWRAFKTARAAQLTGA